MAVLTELFDVITIDSKWFKLWTETFVVLIRPESESVCSLVSEERMRTEEDDLQIPDMYCGQCNRCN
jgi:hypothetical protein